MRSSKCHLTDPWFILCRYSAWCVSRLAETVGTRWFMGWLDGQFGILVLSSHNRAGADQLEERRGCEGRGSAKKTSGRSSTRHRTPRLWYLCMIYHLHMTRNVFLVLLAHEPYYIRSTIDSVEKSTRAMDA